MHLVSGTVTAVVLDLKKKHHLIPDYQTTAALKTRFIIPGHVFFFFIHVKGCVTRTMVYLLITIVRNELP